MTALLDKALTRVRGLPAEKQDFMAAIILREIEGDEKWDGLISDPRSQTLMEQMAAAAVAEFENGQTHPGGFGKE